MADNRELALVLKLVADQFQSELKKSGGALGQFQQFITNWKTQVTLAGTALFAVAKSTANFGEEALKGAQRAGTTVQTFTALSHAANMADLTQQQLTMGLKSLSQAMVDAVRGTGEGATTLRELGVSATTSTGQVKPTVAMLLELADVFAKMPDGAQKADAAVTLFGKAGLDLIPMLNQGKAGITAMMAEAQKLGVVLSQDQAEAASKFNDELKKLDAQVTGLKLSVGNALIPTLTQLIELFRNLGVGSGLGAGLTFIQEHLIKLNVLLKELQANSQFLFGTGKDALSFGQLGERIKEIEAGGRKRLFELQHPGVLTPEGSGSGGSGPAAGAVAAMKDQATIGKELERHAREQVRLGQAKLDIFKSQNEALNIQFRLQQTLQQDEHVLERERAEDAAIQEGLGRFGVRDAQRKVLEEQRAMWAEYTQFETQVLDAAAAAQQKASQGFFDGWVNGLKHYVQATDSAFGLAADMARRTAQLMEQNFRQFFFDLFDGRIQSLKDVLESLGNLVKQIAAQIAAQFATRAVLGAFGLGGASGFGFATGGSFTVGGFGGTDSQPVFFRATPGERVSVQTPGQQAGQQPVMVVVNNYGQNEVTTSSGRGANGQQQITVTVRDMVRKMIAGGEMDKAMRSRFNLTPGEA